MKSTAAFLFVLIFIAAGCKSRFYSENDFASVPKIDSHMHIDADDGVFETLAGEDNFRLITLNVDHSGFEDVKAQNDIAVKSIKQFPGRVFYGATFYFDTTGWGADAWSERTIAELGKYIDGGAVTVKIWKNIGMTERDRNGKFIMVDDPGLDRVVSFIESKGLPITGHLGEPRNCWLPLNQMTIRGDSSYFAANPQYHMYQHSDYPSYEDQINARDNFLKKHPELTFIGCHLGSLEWNIDSLASRLDRFPNMAVDMSARIVHLEFQSVKERDRVRDFCIKYQDRLLYGTDAGYDGRNPEGFRKEMDQTWKDDWKYFTSDEEMTSNSFKGNFTGLKLPKEVVDKIYYGNAVRWYKLHI